MTDFLLRIEREGTPMSQNHYLNSNLQKCRQERIASAVKKSSFSVDMHDGSKRDCYRVSDLVRIHHMSNHKQTVEDIHDILKSYYKVARKRFVGLSPDQLEHIAGEELSIRRRRHRLQKETQDLEAGRKILL